MTTRLSIYNGALRLCKERRMASLTENREPRRLLDDAWADGATEGVVKQCLEDGQWTFATRTVMLDHAPSLSPDFGFRYAFDQPADMVRVCGIWQDEYQTTPLLRYRDERRHWFADLQTIYVSYVSNDASYGADTSLWPEKFTKLVEASLAMEIAGNLTQGRTVQADVEAALKAAKLEARGLDASNLPTSFMPQGGWSSARMGHSSRRNRDYPGGSLT